MKKTILKITTMFTRFVGDDWRAVTSAARNKMKYTQTMCYLEVK